MPQASDELRAKMDGYFGNGGIDDWEPTAFLIGKGWEENLGWWTLPADAEWHKLTEQEFDCITFLIDEWDHAIHTK